MPKKILVKWLSALVITVAIDVLWHRFIFGAWYGGPDSVARVSGGRLAPIIPFIIIADVMFSGALVYFGGLVSEINKKYALNGALLGLLTTGYFSLCAYALVPGWSLNVAGMDTLAGVIIGTAVGLTLKYFSRDSAAA